MSIRISLHNHSEGSPDSDSKIKDMLAKCEKRGIDAIIITDHNKVFKLDSLKGINSNVRVIPGVEVSTKDDCHFLGIFVKKDIPYLKLTGIEVIRRLHEQGAIVIMAHPFRKWQGWMADQYKRSEKEVSQVLKEIDGVEIYNSKCTPAENKRATIYFKDLGIPVFGGADAHTIKEIDNVVMNLDTDIENIKKDFLSAKRKIIVNKINRAIDLTFYSSRKLGKSLLGSLGIKKGGKTHLKLRKSLSKLQTSVKKGAYRK